MEAFFASNRPGGYGGFDIYQATRSAPDDPFSEISLLGPEFNTSGTNQPDTFSEDGLTMYFSSAGLPGEGFVDIFTATRPSTDQAFGNVENIGTGVNTQYRESSATVTGDGLTLYFSSDRLGSGGDRAVWRATRESATDPFQNATLALTDANGWVSGPSVSSDGSTLFHYQTTTDSLHISVATYDARLGRFTDVVNLNDYSLGSSINSPDAGVWAPRISANWPTDGAKLYYNHSTSASDWEIYEATWSVVPEPNTAVLALVAFGIGHLRVRRVSNRSRAIQ